ncbi:ParB/RepB/Spo0J family partition protein [uncultured Bradyrhizobium sp.]|uniref:ParB/RepB/Spo0J family partition protein n=1 Tax=uncultured Bradyrhizobium sp. TaxID=199684 RepID=UPI0035CB136D
MEAEVKSVPLSRLKKSPRNARQVAHTAAEIAALAASIKAHGLLQNPVVEPEFDKRKKPTGYFLVTAGEGRRLALLLLVKQGVLKPSHAVPCTIDTDHDPFEISLAENAVRARMNPADEFEAFHNLHVRKGLSAEDIAGRFGVTPAVVRQRLKLAAVHPALIEVYRSGGMSLEQLTAFAITDDTEAQTRVWGELGDRTSRRDILSALTEAHLPASDPRAAFVSIEAYRAAGGAIVQDLFEAEGQGYFADAALVMRLASEKLGAIADAIKGEGWKWIEIMPRLDYAAVAQFRRVYPKPKDLSEEDQQRLEALEAEYESLEYDVDDEAAEAITRLEEEIAALQGEPVYETEAVGRSGCIVSLDFNGTPRIERGLVRPEDDVKDAKPGRAARAKDEPAPLSEKLIAELTASKTMALRAALGDNPDVALTAVTHALALQACFRGAAGLTCIDVHARSPNLEAILPAIETAPATQTVTKRHEALLKALPDDPAALWEHLAHETPESRLALMAHCLAFSVDAVQRPGPYASEPKDADQLAQALGLDMASHWRPTATNYLGRVSKERILQAVAEGVSKEAADNLATLPKAAMADTAEARLAETRWLPELLRRSEPEPEAEAEQSGGKRPRQRRAARSAAPTPR